MSKIRNIVTKNITKWLIFRNLSHYIFARNSCQGRSDWGLWEEGVKLPPTVKFRQQLCKILIKNFDILKF